MAQQVFTLEELEAAIYLSDLPDECPYLPNRVATFRFGNGYIGVENYRRLLDAGYRRNGVYVYRPACRTCHECQIIRVPVQTFRPSRDQRRIWNRCHGNFELRVKPPSYSWEKEMVYTAYLAYQHGDDEGPFDESRYRRFLVDTCLGPNTLELQLWRGDQLGGLGILDRVEDALSTVYFFFNPVFARYSLGTYSVLLEIDLARRWGLKYYYLGHYIRDCASMNYKARFRPCEIKAPDDTSWETLRR